MNLKTILLVVVCSLFIATSGFTAGQNEPVMFEDIDTDADGSISKNEAKARKDLRKNFRKADTDKSGTINVDEYTAFHNRGRMDIEEVEIPEVGAAPVN